MTSIHFERALTPAGWCRDMTLHIADGLIAAVELGRPTSAGTESHAVGLPGLPNLHSHAFQRAMSGLAETRGHGPDTFWSWREAMYRTALAMRPEDVEAVAGQLYVEMLEAGFTRVGEFHYLHNEVDGRPYADRAEMAKRIAAAASAAGIGLTLIPVLYRSAGFGGVPAQASQRRFTSDLDGYAAIVEGTAKAVAGLEGANLGLAPHSLRAASPDEVRAVAALAAGRPVHIHVAEQRKEVEDCLAWSGARPVDWLLDNAPVDATWCLVHATHMTALEAQAVAARGAVAGLCPITEANLGDGAFDGPGFAAHGGRFGIGTDSNVSIGAADELRQLEYSQRQHRMARNVMAGSGRSTGLALLEAALVGGSAALGQGPAGIVLGAAADIVSLRADHPKLAGHGDATLLDAWIFGGGDAVIDCVWTRGRKRVQGGQHEQAEAAGRRFAATMARLAAAG